MLEAEVVELRKKAEQLEAHVKMSSSILDEILESQRSTFHKTSLGYSKKMKETKEGSIFDPFVAAQNKEEVKLEVKNKPYVPPRPQARFRREPAPRYDQTNRYDGIFHGYCFSCNDYGHRAVDCRRDFRRSVGRPNNQIRCWTCGMLGHVASVCNTMRCYNCDGLGHRAQDCWYSRQQPMWNGSTRGQPMWNGSARGQPMWNGSARSQPMWNGSTRRQPMWNGSTKRTDEQWRTNRGSSSGQNAVGEQRKPQMWMKKTELWQRGRLLVSLSLTWSCMVCLCLMFVIDVNWVFDCGLVLGLGPLWSPSCVLVVVLSGRPFPHVQAQVWSHLESFEMSQEPLWVCV